MEKIMSNQTAIFSQAAWPDEYGGGEQRMQLTFNFSRVFDNPSL